MENRQYLFFALLTITTAIYCGEAPKPKLQVDPTKSSVVLKEERIHQKNSTIYSYFYQQLLAAQLTPNSQDRAKAYIFNFENFLKRRPSRKETQQ